MGRRFLIVARMADPATALAFAKRLRDALSAPWEKVTFEPWVVVAQLTSTDDFRRVERVLEWGGLMASHHYDPDPIWIASPGVPASVRPFDDDHLGIGTAP